MKTVVGYFEHRGVKITPLIRITSNALGREIFEMVSNPEWSAIFTVEIARRNGCNWRDIG